MSSIFHGGNTYIFYNTDGSNVQPNSVDYKNIDQLGAFPQVKINSSNTTLETYNDEWVQVLSGNMIIDSVSIVVHYIADNDSHVYLNNAFTSGTAFQIKIALYESNTSLEQHYIVLNGHISGYQDSGDQNQVYDRKYTFVPTSIVSRGTATDPANLRVGDYGVGADGELIPHVESEIPSGNSFIKVPALRTDNTVGVDMGGIAFIDNGGDKYANIVATTEGQLNLYACNSDSAWTQIPLKSDNDALYVPMARTVNGKALSSNITLSASDVSALPLSGGTLAGALNGTTATFSGALTASSATFSGTVSTGTLTATTGNYSGSITAASLNLTTDLSIANGGTGASTAQDALTNLGAVAKAGDTMTGTLNGTEANYTGSITGREINTAERQTMSRSDAAPYLVMNRLDQVDGTLPVEITQLGYIQADLTTTDGSPYGRALGSLGFDYDTSGGGRTTLAASNVAGTNSSMIVLDGDEALATVTGAVQVNSTLTTSDGISRSGSGTLSFNANRTDSATDSYYGAQTTAGSVYFGTGSGTNFIVNGTQSSTGSWLSMDGTNATFKTKLTVPAIAVQSVTGLSGTLTLGADAIGAYDAVTLRQLQASTGSGSATLNGVMNNFLGAVEWFLGTRAAMPGGHLACDGQLLSRTTYADLWAAVSSNVFISVTESVWQGSAAQRGKFSTGDGSTTFRMPDLNGVQSDSIKALFLRGDQGISGGVGSVAASAAPNITGEAAINLSGVANIGLQPATSGAVIARSAVTNLLQTATGIQASGTGNTGFKFDASQSSSVYVTGASEVRPNFAAGIWVMRVNGLFSAANTNFNVITADTALPATGTIVYGGDIRSAYRVAGAETNVARLRSKYIIGTDKYASLSIDGGTGEMTVSSGGEVSSTSTNTYRIANSTGTSAFQRLDNANWYFMFSDTPTGSYNALRPIAINQSSGTVTMGNGLAFTTGGGGIVMNGNTITSSGQINFSNTSNARQTLINTGVTGSVSSLRIPISTTQAVLIQSGTSVISFNSSGEATLTFPTGFTSVNTFVCSNGDANVPGDGYVDSLDSWSLTTTGTNIRNRRITGGGSVIWVTGAYRINWIATGIVNI